MCVKCDRPGERSLQKDLLLLYHHLTKTFHLTLKMTTAQIVETLLIKNSLSEHYSHPDNHTRQKSTYVASSPSGLV